MASKPGEGSEFAFSLPVAPTEVMNHERGPGILVIDDDPQIRQAMRTTLTARGYQVGDARTGEEGLEELRSSAYDLVLLDMNMPGMGGIETCRVIRLRSSEAAIIMLTVSNTERDKVEALDAGADDYITKPFGMPELLARIRATLRRLPQPATDNTDLAPLISLGVHIDLPSSAEATVRGLHLPVDGQGIRSALVPPGAPQQNQRRASQNSCKRFGARTMETNHRIPARFCEPPPQEN